MNTIKPKKLVFLDEGFFSYVDTDGLWKYKNVNRVVTVDLDTFSVRDVAQTDTYFYTDRTSDFVMGQISPDEIASAEYYYNQENGSGFIKIGKDGSSDKSGWWFRVPLDD